MTLSDINYCVILAGGRGKRLWPCSRESYPKQFLDLFGVGRTLIQQTFDRMRKIIPVENIIISTNADYVDIVREQLPDVLPDHILGEPVPRNTAPSLCWANHHITSHNPEAHVVVVPSDQMIIKEDSFLSSIEKGLELVGHEDVVLTMGVKPTRPEPGYGYIQLGEIDGQKNVYHVQSFTEKPDRQFAQMFLDSGEFYWNTGIFISSNRVFRETFTKVLPPILREYDSQFGADDSSHEEEYIRTQFSRYPNMSIDSLVLEKSDNVYVMVCDFGWADLGTWHSIYESKSNGTTENVVMNSQVFIDDCKGSIIKLPKGKLAVLNGLKDFIVVEEGNVLFICKKEDSSALIRKYLNEIQIKCGDDFI